MSVFVVFVRFIVRLFLTIISLLSGLFGAYGLFVFIVKTDTPIAFISENSDKWFFAFTISDTPVGVLLAEYTSRSVENVSLPIIFIVVGVITWVSQVGLSKKHIYRRIRFSHPTAASPLAWFMVIAAVIATVYVIANWNSIDHTVASLVIVANLLAILWNTSIIR